jgi:hypothetical protein
VALIDAQWSPASCSSLLNQLVLLADVGLVVGFSGRWHTEAQCKGKPQPERGKQLGLS